MPRRPPRPRPTSPRPKAAESIRSAGRPSADPPESAAPAVSFWTRPRIALAVGALLAIHLSLAVQSLLQENPTVDEVAHLPAGVSYWQKGTFRLYHHNPPLVKLVAALPVVLADPVTEPIYQMPSWKTEPPAHPTFSQTFAFLNADRYFELFDRARLLMPAFSVLGALAVFAWSSRLFGALGGLISLALWCLCPNVLAHGRLLTSDMGATALGVGATYLFWRYLHQPTWRRALLAGAALGLAELSKFSLILLYGLWPFLWSARLLLHEPRGAWARIAVRAIPQGLAIVALSVFVIDLGYGFEGVGTPLGRFEFSCRSLTRPTRPGEPRPSSPNLLLELAWQHRVNRFRGTALGALPCPLPSHYMLGFDEQKLETEGIPRRFQSSERSGGDEELLGYYVYLDGVLRRKGWGDYYLKTLLYKVPEGTWLLVVAAIAVLIASPRSRVGWADELAIATVPVTIFITMTFLTDINLGLRYVLPIFPYVYIAAGRLGPWLTGLAGVRRTAAAAFVALALGLTALATATIHPHYLAYFNAASGGPDRRPARLIDSNLDWGQDLVGLQRWLKANAPGEPVGLAYFGQINPSIFQVRGEGFEWFLPPLPRGSYRPLTAGSTARFVGPAPRLTPGLYAISATLVNGLPWRLYDPAKVGEAWPPAWNVTEPDALGYFRKLTPIARIGHSIDIYRLSADDAARLTPLLDAAKPATP